MKSLDQVGTLVRIRHSPDQPTWTRRLAGKVGVVVSNERVGYNTWVLEVLVEGTVWRLHPVDLEPV